MPDIFAGFDILGVGTMIGSLLLLGALVWVLVDNRSFDEVNRRHAAEMERRLPVPAPGDAAVDEAATAATAEGVEGGRARSPWTADASSRPPRHPGRVA